MEHRANDILNNKFYYFSDKLFDFCGWNYSVKTHKYSPTDKHWSKISDLNSDFGDIKWIWELNRFTFSYDLARAYIYTRDSKYVEKFWELFDDFILHNPLELGANYKCSQEMSFRSNAWLFALYHFIDHPLSTEKRIENMVKCIYHYAHHIMKHLNFSVEAVKNNHSISEAATLTVLGNTFDFLPSANKFFEKGNSILEKEIKWQIKEDGSFIQHSHNYHRLVLQNISWHLTSMNSVNKQVAIEIREKANKSLNYFRNVISSEGKVPNYGMNDGSYIMPLNERGYDDYRPVLQCLYYQLNGNILYEEESVNELLSLLDNDFESSKKLLVKRENKPVIINKYGGYHILTYEKFKVFIKSKTYKERPVQADMNHVDIWYEDKCIFGDAGTYSYNDEEEVLNYFNGTSSHNTVLINDENQMIKGDRFIWYNWSKSLTPSVKVLRNHLEIQVELINYNEYRHIRNISLFSNKVIIKDIIINSKQNDTNLKLQWLTPCPVKQITNEKLLVDNKWNLTFSTESELNTKLYFGNNQDEFRGWISSTYGEKHPANQVVSEFNSSKENIEIVTTLTKDYEEL